MRWFSVLVGLALATAGTSVQAHGFSLKLSGNSLVATSDSPTSDGNLSVFVGEQFSDIAGKLQADHGAVGGGSAFIVGKHFSFDAFGPLWFSNGSDATPAAPGVTLKLIDQQAGFTGQSIVMSATSPGKTTGFPISGRTSHEFIWELTIDTTVPGHVTSIPNGVYGVGYIVKGGLNGGADFLPTPLLVTGLTTPDFDPDPTNPNPNVDLAGIAIYRAATAVPEPTTLALAVMGLGGVVCLVGRRQRRLHK